MTWVLFQVINPAQGVFVFNRCNNTKGKHSATPHKTHHACLNQLAESICLTVRRHRRGSCINSKVKCKAASTHTCHSLIKTCIVLHFSKQQNEGTGMLMCKVLQVKLYSTIHSGEQAPRRIANFTRVTRYRKQLRTTTPEGRNVCKPVLTPQMLVDIKLRLDLLWCCQHYICISERGHRGFKAFLKAVWTGSRETNCFVEYTQERKENQI